MKIALCFLTFNEIEGCRHDIPLFDFSHFDAVYAVDGGSTDGTIAYLKAHNIPVYIQPAPGLNAAHIYAVEKCPADAVVIFHPKGSIPVGDTYRFRPYFKKGYELIVGSRNCVAGKNEEDGHPL